MKFPVTMALVVGLALPGVAIAADNTPGFTGPGVSSNMTLNSVKDVLQSGRDEQRVVLEGNIVRKLTSDDDDYAFQDRTGEIIVEIDDKIFGGRSVNPDTRVRLTGNVDTHRLRASSIDVDRLEIVDRVRDAGNAVRGFVEELVE